MSITKTKINNFHQPVLLESVLSLLNPKNGDSYLDMTAGYGGHAGAVLAKTRSYAKSVLVDRDQQAIDVLGEFAKQGSRLIHDNFYSATKALVAEGEKFDMILMDLGLSSPHLNNPSRGFAFSSDGPLDMRMDQAQAMDAASLVNQASEHELTDILHRYGEEYKATRIAESIMRARPIHTTSQLAEVIVQAVGWGKRGSKKQKIHPATKTFQALRVAVNDELSLLEQTLPLTLRLLKTDGRIAIISFHSLEDRITKGFLRENARSGWQASLQLINKKPITASENEIVSNPRARSAKLRAAVKI